MLQAALELYSNVAVAIRLFCLQNGDLFALTSGRSALEQFWDVLLRHIFFVKKR